MLSFMKLNRFSKLVSTSSVLCPFYAEVNGEKNWSQLKAIINKVHTRVFDHASLTDFKPLLVRNKFWTTEVAD